MTYRTAYFGTRRRKARQRVDHDIRVKSKTAHLTSGFLGAGYFPAIMSR